MRTIMRKLRMNIIARADADVRREIKDFEERTGNKFSKEEIQALEDERRNLYLDLKENASNNPED